MPRTFPATARAHARSLSAALLIGFAVSTVAQSTSTPASTSTSAPQTGASSGQADKDKTSPNSGPSAIAPAPPPHGPTGRPRIGLALGGGGAIAISEIGVLQWFEEHHIPVDMIAGTSMGSLVGALYSTGKTPDEMKLVMNTRVFSQLFRLQTEYNKLNFRRREDARDLPNSISIGLRHGISLRNSVLIDVGLNALLSHEFYRYDNHSDFNELPIPFRAISTDVNDAKSVTFARGSIPDAVRASVSLPGIFRPFRLNDHDYVDGGVLENLPTRAVHEMKADVVLAVSMPLQPVAKGDLDSIVGVLQRSFSVAIEQNERESRRLADVVMVPDIAGFNGGDYLKSVELAARGYASAEQHKAELMKYAVSDAEWQEYLRSRAARTPGMPASVLNVRVKAPTPDVQHAVQRLFAGIQNKPINLDTIEALLADVRSDGSYEADYAVVYERPSEPTIVVTVTAKSTGPPFLNLGFNIAAESSATPRWTIEGIYLHQDLGGYGSELRAHIRAGWMNELSGEYFRKLPGEPLGGRTKEGVKLGELFLAPNVDILREPFYIYRNKELVSQRQLQSGGGGLDFGWTDRRKSEIRLGWELKNIRWTSEVGSDSDGMPNIYGNMQRVHLRFIYDTQDRALVPHYGARIVTQAAYLFDAPTGSNAPVFTAQGDIAHRLGANNLAIVSFDSGTMFNRNVAEPFRFTLGGPLRLTASSFDEFRGTDFFFVSPAYLRRIASLPAILGQNIYAGVGYEAGQMRSPNGPTVTRQDAYFGLVAETPLGTLLLAPAIGDDGHYKLVFSLGKLF